MQTILRKYAQLLADYCLDLQGGDRLYLRSTTLAEPLVREVYRAAVARGALVEVDLAFREQNRIFLEAANDNQLRHISPAYRQAIETFDALLVIRAPFNLREDQNVDPRKSKVRKDAQRELLQTYFQRTGKGEMRRCLCQYPTPANAQEAGMSLEEYEQFVYGACRLFEPNPAAAWLEMRRHQQQIVDRLHQHKAFRYVGEGTDIRFSTEGRTWINSDGRSNMPSGEVFTSPVEDSVNGVVHFSYPAVYMGHEVEGVTLWVKDGWVDRWEARHGQAFLDRIFDMHGARRFGEAAIGTNPNIDRFTKNILFDEKIGGTVHLAIGQSYLQAGGKNQSAVHWDMIADMTQGGVIYADDDKIYENGKFLFL